MMSAKGNIVVTCNNKGLATAIQMLLEKEFSNVINESDNDKIVQLSKKISIDIIVADMGQELFGNIKTLQEFIRTIKEIDNKIQIVLLANYSQNSTAFEGVENGAFDFVMKPWNNEKLLVTVRNAFRMKQQLTSMEQIDGIKKSIRNRNQFYWGISTSSKGIFELAKKYSREESALIIYGEKGTGKELLAEQIHSMGPRSAFPFIRIDGASASEEELYRYIKLAERGTVYIDNFENLNPGIKPIINKILLDTLDTTVLRDITSTFNDIRIIIGSRFTPHELKDDKTLGNEIISLFRKNNIKMPALHERKEDILPLATILLQKYCRKHNKTISGFSEPAKQVIEEYRWTGNISELSLAIERAVMTTSGGNPILPGSILLSGNSSDISKDSIGTLTIEEMEGKMMRAALKRYNGNITLAAEQLGVTRQTLYNKGKKHKLFE